MYVYSNNNDNLYTAFPVTHGGGVGVGGSRRVFGGLGEVEGEVGWLWGGQGGGSSSLPPPDQ